MKFYDNSVCIIAAVDVPLLESKTLVGKWKGEQETSYLYLCPDKETERIVTQAACEAGEDSVLHLDNQRNATIIHTTPYQWGEKEHIGTFVSCAGAVAEKEDCYTYDPTSKTYYVVR